ncbi:hypothetical protein [Marinovum algicola]|uniref:hypothetical protein n=1 Tax=Marinovum algicola TaxID=42444 RepID=UPI003529F95C
MPIKQLRKRALAMALVCSTALTAPSQAAAEPVTLFFQGFLAATGFYGAAGGAVATALGGAAAAGAAVGGFLFGTLAGRVLLSLALSAVVNLLTPQPEIPRPSAQFANYVQPISPFERVYGEVKKGGVMAFRSGIRDKQKHMVITVAAHPCEGPQAHFLDLREVTLAKGSAFDGVMLDHEVITKPYKFDDPPRSRVSIRPFTGAPGQVADPILVSTFTEFTAAHDFAGHSGVAYYCREVPQEDFLEVYPSGREAVYTGIWRGWNEIYDPRSDATGWSQNWALCLAHELVNVWGLDVDWDRVAVEADICDALVTNGDGGTQKRWTFNHTFTDDQDFQTVIAQFLGAADGYLWQRPDGKVDFYAGRWLAPTLALEARDFFSCQVIDGNQGLNPKTEYWAEYREPDNGYRETPSAAWVVDAEAGRNAQQLALYPIDSHNQVLRVLKPLARAERARFKITGTIGLIGYELIGGRDNDAGGTAGLAHRFVTVSHPVLGEAVICEVAKVERMAGGNSFTVELISTAEEDRQFVAATEEPARPSYNAADVEGTDPIDTIDDLAGTAVSGTGGVAQINWTWTAPDSSLSPDLRLREQGGDWQLVSLPSGTGSFLQTGLIDGATYQAEIRSRHRSNRVGEWRPLTPVEVVAVADTTPPGAHVPGSFALSETGGDVTVSFEAPNDAPYHATRILRADYASAPGSYDIADASLVRLEYGLPGQVDSWEDSAVSAGHHAYWIEPINASGVAGPVSGPETIDTV